MADYSGVLLVLFDLHDQSSELLVHDGFLRFRQPQIYEESQLRIHSASAGWQGTHAILKPTALPPQLFEELPAAVFLRGEEIGGFVLRQLFIRLTPGQFVRLSKRDPNQDPEIGAFARQLLPIVAESRVLPRDSDKYCSLLELTVSEASARDMFDLSRRTRIELGSEKTVLIPIAIEEVLVLPGPAAIGVEDSLTTVCSFLPHASEQPELSRVAADLIELAVAPSALEFLRKRLRNLPLARYAPSEYVKRRDSESRNSLAMYAAHLNDRETLLDAILAYDDRVKLIEAAIANLTTTRVMRGGNAITFPGVVAEQYPSPFAYDPVSGKVVAFNNQLREYRAARDGAEARDRLIAEYLRDKVNAGVAVSNLAIQRTVTGLTAVAIFLAVAALIEGVLPETFRLAIGNWLIAWLHRLLGK